MEHAEYHLVLRLRGEMLRPKELTSRLGVEPSKVFDVGEHPKAHSKHLAGWDWCGRVSDNPAELFAEFLAVFEPVSEDLQCVVADGAIAFLTLVGAVYGDLVMTPQEADQRRLWVDPAQTFEPMFVADRVGLWLDRDLIGFLAGVGCEFGTHIDYEVDRIGP